MNSDRIHKLMWRWSIITAGIISIFWTIWYLINGQVPEINQITILPGNILDAMFPGNDQSLIWILPFGISRWWDVLLGPIWVIIFIKFIKLRISKKILSNVSVNDQNFIPIGDLIACLLITGIVGIVTLTIFGPIVGPIVCLIFALIVGPPIGLIHMSIGLNFGLIFGLPLSLVYSLVIILVYALVYGLICSFPSCISWLTAKD